MLKPVLLKQLTMMVAVLTMLAFGFGSWLSSQASFIQLIRPASTAEADLFGDTPTGPPGTPIGSPQYLIIRSPEAFVEVAETKNKTGQTIRYVSEPKLSELGEYPLQLKTVLFFRNAVLIGGLLLTLLLAVLWNWSLRRSKNPAAA